MPVQKVEDYPQDKSAAVLVQGVEFTYPGASEPVLTDLSLKVQLGDFAAVVGPNGVGKSTLLRLITGYLTADEGRVMIKGVPIRQMSHLQRARTVALVRQTRDDRFRFTVQQLVAMGRTPHSDRLGRLSSCHRQIVDRVLRLCNLQHLAHRPITSLSGGERQRAAVAKALAQQPDILLLDEPTAHLDIHYQMQILDLVGRLNGGDQQTTVVVVLHDLNLASRYCNRLFLLSGGGVYQSGSPRKVLNFDNIAEVYGTDRLTIIQHPQTKKPVLIPGD